MASRGLKRTVSPYTDDLHKKARLDFFNEGNHTHSSQLGLSDVVSAYSFTEEDLTESNAPTPQTPISSKDSPSWPSNLKTITCTYSGCDKSFNRPAKLAQHLRSHTNTRSFICPHEDCSKDFLRSFHLQRHVKSAHSEIRDYVCQYEGCGKSFITGTRLRRHIAAHEGRQDFPCGIHGCGQTFRKHNTLQKHIISVHEGKKPFVCQLPNDGEPCGAGFETASHLKTHEGSVHSDNLFRCTACGAMTPYETGTTSDRTERAIFPSLSGLQEHLRAVHPPTCQDCNKRFRCNADLTMHIESHHANLNVGERRKHLCLEPGCGRSFTQKGNLVTHMNNLHLETKAFVCGAVDLNNLTRIDNWDGLNACGRPMTTKGNLVEHIRTVHLGHEPSRKTRRKQKAADAKACVSQATSSTMKLLTGSEYKVGRGFECLFRDCDYRFQREYDLRRHLKIHHELGELDIESLSDSINPAMIRPGLNGSYYVANPAEVNADRALSQQFGNSGDFEDYFEELEESAAVGGDFWLGGQQQGDDLMSGVLQWDSVEMPGMKTDERPSEAQIKSMDQDVIMVDPGLQ